jgi:hypothetical protein
MKKVLAGFISICAVVVFGVSALAQNGEFEERRAERFNPDRQDKSRPLREIAPKRHFSTNPDHEVKRLPAQLDGAPDRLAKTSVAPSTAAISPGAGFDGLGVGGGYTPDAAPPDTNGAVGATQYVQWVNESFAVYSKTTGARIYGPAAGNTLWAGFGGPCEAYNDGDPIAQYDKAANRWVMTQFAVSAQPYTQCIAVSDTPDAMGTYHRYAFSYGRDFNDYPKVGIWPDAYYITYNMFRNGRTFIGSKVCAIDRAAILGTAARSVTQQCVQLSNSFGGLLPADLDGSIAPPAGEPGLLLNFGTNLLNFWRFRVNWTTPASTTLTGPTQIAVAAFARACSGGACIPQLGTTQRLDSLADRLMYRLAYRRFADGHEALVVNHSVTSGSVAGIRWYEIRNPTGGTFAAGTPVVFQQGTYAPDTLYRWMGSAAMDKAGNIAIGYSTSNSANYPAIRFTGRSPSDPLGTLNATETIIQLGGGAQLATLSRWGDYSSFSVDPVDDCTMWYTTEYLKANGTFNWSTRIASFRFSTCL